MRWELDRFDTEGGARLEKGGLPSEFSCPRLAKISPAAWRICGLCGSRAQTFTKSNSQTLPYSPYWLVSTGAHLTGRAFFIQVVVSENGLRSGRSHLDQRYPRVERRIVIACSLTSNPLARCVTWSSHNGSTRSALTVPESKLDGIRRQAANWLASISLRSPPVLDLELRGVIKCPRSTWTCSPGSN